MSSEKQLGALIGQARRDRKMSLAGLASQTYVSRGWINNVEAGRRWPGRAWLEQADDSLSANGTLVAEWDRQERRRSTERDLRTILSQSARESELLISIQPDVFDIDELQQSIADLSVAYLASPAQPMLVQGMALRKELTRRLTSGAVRPHEMADLYVALGRVSGVLAYAAVDLNSPDVAAIHARTAWQMADAAGDNELRAWVRGTQSLIARFSQQYGQAQRFINDGLRYAGDGTSEIRLLCGAAQCAANLGDKDSALRFIEHADRARDNAKSDTIEGLFGFSLAKQAYYSGSSLMWLPDNHALLIAANSAETAIDLWQRESLDHRSLDDEALAHVYLATARLRLGEIAGAMEAVRPVINLPEDRQISWIRKRINNLASILKVDKYHNSKAAAAARDELKTY